MKAFLSRAGLLGDLLSSGVIAGFTSAANLVGVLLFAHALQPGAFGLLSTCRRIGAFFASFANLNGHLAICRYLGYYASEPLKRSGVLAVGLLLCAAVPVVTALLFLAMRRLGADVAWVQQLEDSIWTATYFLATSLSISLIVFSVLRGLGHPAVANLQQLAYVSGVLVLALASKRLQLETLVASAAVIGMIVNTGFFVWGWCVHRSELTWPSRRELKRCVRKVLRYSLPRVADGPSQASLSLIGVVFAPAIGGLALAGYIHISQTMVRMTEILVFPLSVVFLPLAARHVREGRVGTLVTQTQWIYDGVIVLGCFVAVQSLVWAPPLLSAAFGEKYRGAEPFLMLTLPATLPYLLYAGFRSVIDGYSVRPVNFLHLLVSAAAVLFCSLTFGGVHEGAGLAASYTVGVTLLGILSVGYVKRHFGVRVVNLDVLKALGFALVAGVVASLLAGRVRALPAPVALLVFVAAQVFLVPSYFAALVLVRHRAVAHAGKRLRDALAGSRSSVPSAATATESPNTTGVVASRPTDRPELVPAGVNEERPPYADGS